MEFLKQMSIRLLRLLVSVLLMISSLVNSKLIINEFKLWGDPSSQFIELYNMNDSTEVLLSTNYSVFLLDEPGDSKQDLQVYHVIDISQYDTVNASGYLAIETPNISHFIEKNNTYAIVLHKLINGSDFELGDVVKPEEMEDAVVFTHDDTLISLLSYKLNLINDHGVFDITENESLNVCDEDLSRKVHVFEFKEPSSGQQNICDKELPVVASTTVITTTQQTTSTPITIITSPAVNGSSPPTSTEPVTSTVTSPQPSTTTLPKTTVPTIAVLTDPSNLTINEFNIYMGDHTHTRFVEIHGQPNALFENTTLELINGEDGSSIGSYDITKTDEKGLFVHKFASLTNSIGCLVLAIKQGDKVIDVFVISKDGSVKADLLENYSPTQDIFILDPSVVNISTDLALSVSKCGRYPGFLDGGFMLTSSSMGDQNNCSTYYHKKIQLKLLNADCKLFKDNVELKNEIADAIIRTTSKICKCGLSSPVLQERSIYCDDVVFEAFIGTVTKQESENYFKIYQHFVNTTEKITIGKMVYDIDNTCYDDCHIPVQPTEHKTKDGDINVTIAIVVTCVVIFIVIVVIVVILLKKKRNGTLQFSMVRLEEDNNLLMDDAKGVRFREGSAIII